MSKTDFDFHIEPWSVVSENKEYTTPIFKLLKRRMKLQAQEENNQGDFYILEAPAWINVIALTSDSEIVLVEQYRYGVQEPTLEIPGGMVDPGEEQLEAASRELLEETGYRSDSWRSLGKVSSNPAILNNYTYLFIAEDCQYVGSEHQDSHERIIVHKMPIDDFLDLVKEGTVHHAIVLAAVARYLLEREK